MKIVIEGKVYDPKKTPILVVLDPSDITTIRDMTMQPSTKPLDLFECPEKCDDALMDALCAAWKESVRQYEEAAYLGGKLPFTIQTKDHVKRIPVLEKLMSAEGITVVDMKGTDHGIEFYVHCDPAQMIILNDLVCDYGVEVIKGGHSERPILPEDA